MSQVQHNSSFAFPRNWLTAGALWGVIGSWGALGVWGWLQTAQGWAAVILVALAIGAQVISARMVVHAGAASNWRQATTCLLLGIGCMAFAGVSGKRGLDQVEAQRLAPYQTAMAKHNAAAKGLAKIEAQIPPPVRLALNVPAERVERLNAVRNAELARLEPLRAKAAANLAAEPLPVQPMPALPGALAWAIVALIEALEFFGFWAVGAAHQRPTQNGSGNVVPLDPSEAGRRLVGLRKDRQTA